MNKKEQGLTYALGSEWYSKLKDVFETDALNSISTYLRERAKESKGYPPKKPIIIPEKKDWFKAFRLTPFSDVRVVILGGYPYDKVINGQPISDGLAWSSEEPFETPQACKDIFDELETDIYDGLYVNRNADFKRWASQGVFLLNEVLTCEKDKPAAHSSIGWDTLTGKALQLLLEDTTPKIFVIWGEDANAFFEAAVGVSEVKGEHHVLKAQAPGLENEEKLEPFLSPFKGCKHFSQINTLLKDLHNYEIQW